jgi:hypothetical protein
MNHCIRKGGFWQDKNQWDIMIKDRKEQAERLFFFLIKNKN